MLLEDRVPLVLIFSKEPLQVPKFADRYALIASYMSFVFEYTALSQAYSMISLLLINSRIILNNLRWLYQNIFSFILLIFSSFHFDLFLNFQRFIPHKGPNELNRRALNFF